MNKKVDKYFNEPKKWKRELTRLREIVIPCYTYKEKNVLLIHEFKNYCAILFHQGALLKDPKNILVQQTENIQSARQIRFISLSEIEKLDVTIKRYIDFFDKSKITTNMIKYV